MLMKNSFMNLILFAQSLLSIPLCQMLWILTHIIVLLSSTTFFACTCINPLFLKRTLKFFTQSSSNLLCFLGQTLSQFQLSGLIPCCFLPHVLCSTHSDKHLIFHDLIIHFCIHVTTGEFYSLFKEQLKCYFLSTAIPDHRLRHN